MSRRIHSNYPCPDSHPFAKEVLCPRIEFAGSARVVPFVLRIFYAHIRIAASVCWVIDMGISVTEGRIQTKLIAGMMNRVKACRVKDKVNGRFGIRGTCLPSQEIP